MADPCDPPKKNYGVTDNVCLPYPEGPARVDIAGDIRRLAEAADWALTDRPACPKPYPPDLTGVDGHVVASNIPLTWGMLPTQDADNGSLRLFDDSHPLYDVYEFDADWDNKRNLSWLLDVLQFRGNQISNGAYAFYGMPADELTALPDLDTSNLTDMTYMFQTASNFNQDISHFDFSNLTDMSSMFSMAAAFDQDIGGWDTSNVANMSQMFSLAASFDQDISGWCVEKIGAKPFNFDAAAGFEGQTAKQPKWGVAC